VRVLRVFVRLNHVNSSFAQGQRHYSACYERILPGRTPKRLLLNEADRCEDAPSSTDASVLDAAQRDEKQKSAHAASALLLAAQSSRLVVAVGRVLAFPRPPGGW